MADKSTRISEPSQLLASPQDGHLWLLKVGESPVDLGLIRSIEISLSIPKPVTELSSHQTATQMESLGRHLDRIA